MHTRHVRTNHVSPTTCEKWRERDYVARQEATPHSKVRTGRFHYMFEIGLFFVFFSLGVRGLGLGVLKVRIGLGRPVQPFGLGSQFMR